MTEQERQQQAKELGKIAFKNNIQCAPCLDKDLMEMVKNGTGVVGSSLGILKAWQKGWTMANLAANW